MTQNTPASAPQDGTPWMHMRLVDGVWTVLERGEWENPDTPKFMHTEVGDRLVIGERAYECTGYEDRAFVLTGALGQPRVAIFEEVNRAR